MFDPLWKLALGLFTGILFGLLLQKGRVAKYKVILDQFLFRDWTVFKVMGTAIIVGAIGIYALLPTEAVSLHIKPLAWSGIIIGGVLFGVGMALLGYCPGTSVAACGEGRKDAMVGVAGMFAGAFAYVGFFSAFDTLRGWFGDLGKVTLPELTSTTPWLWIGGLALIALILYGIGRLSSRSETGEKRRPVEPNRPRRSATARGQSPT